MANKEPFDPTYEYNAPQFVDFTSQQDLQDHDVEDYFNFDHEAGGKPLMEWTPAEEDTSVYEDAKTQPPTPAPEKTATPSSSRRSVRRGSYTVETPTQVTPNVVRSASVNRCTPRSSSRVKRSASAAADIVRQERHTPQARRSVAADTEESAPRSATRRTPRARRSVPAVVDTEESAPSSATRRTPRARRSAAATVPVAQTNEENEAPKKPQVVSSSPPEGVSQDSGVIKMQVPANLCTSLSAWRSRTKSVVTNGGTSKSTRRSPRVAPAPSNNMAVSRELGKSPATKRIRTMTTGTPIKQTKSSARSRARTLSNNKTLKISVARDTSRDKKPLIPAAPRGRTRTTSSKKGGVFSFLNCSSTSTTSSSSLDGTRRSQGSSRSQSPSAKPKLTMPLTPSFLKRKAATAMQIKSSEQQEMDTISKMRQELAKKRKIAEESFKKMQTSSAYVPIRSHQPLTKPAEFDFKTDTRISKTHEMHTRGDDKDFVSRLREQTSSQAAKPLPRMTIPQPFNLHERKRKRTGEVEPSSDKFMSMAERVNKFSKQTPDRFRSKPKNQQGFLSFLSDDHSGAKRHKKDELTVPKTPQLMTRGRHRETTAVSHQEMEEKEIEEMKRYHFHANPVNKRIMKFANTGVPKVAPKEATRPVEFELETDRRREQWNVDKKEEEEAYEFHARPAPTAIFKRPQGMPPAKEIPLTIPESPAFALKNRLRPKSRTPEEKNENKPALRANPVPHVGIPFQPKLNHRVTDVQPFSFEQRDRHMMSRKEQKIQQIYEEERRAREFKAQPLYDLSPELPPKRTKPITVPQPFNLEIDHRGAKIAEEWSHKVEEELRQQRAMAKFKARPATVVQREPFKPKRSLKPLTDVNDFELHTDKRSEQRQEWEMYKHMKEMEVAAEKEAAERRRQEEEEQEVRRQRRDAVHKANPVKYYRSVDIQSSDKPLTVPHTPRFSERLRNRTVRM